MSNDIYKELAKKYPKAVKDLSNEPFYAILTTTSVTTPGDERSRTNPGHGYPESTSDYWNMQVFPTKIAWEAEIKKLSDPDRPYKEKFKAVYITPAKVTVKVDISTEIA